MSLALPIALHAVPRRTEVVKLILWRLSRREPHIDVLNGALWGYSHNAAIIRSFLCSTVARSV